MSIESACRRGEDRAFSGMHDRTSCAITHSGLPGSVDAKKNTTQRKNGKSLEAGKGEVGFVRPEMVWYGLVSVPTDGLGILKHLQIQRGMGITSFTDPSPRHPGYFI